MITKKKHTLMPRECTTLACLERARHERLVHKLHKKHGISYKTLFYMKEYGQRSHVATVIIGQSLKMLLLTVLISSIGGIKLKGVEDSLLTIMPLLILLPALNTMIGSAGTIISSKFTTMLYMGRVRRKWWEEHEVQELIFTIFLISIISSLYIGSLSYLVAYFRGFAFDLAILGKVIGIAVLSTVVLVTIIMYVSIRGGTYIYGKKEDPNNFLIPATTSLGDFGSLLIFSTMVAVFF